MRHSIKIDHGIPQHEYFAIMQPCYDCYDYSKSTDGIGEVFELVNPQSKEVSQAVLVSRQWVYTDADHFESLSFLIYGINKQMLMKLLLKRYPGAIPEAIYVWTFRKVK